MLDVIYHNLPKVAAMYKDVLNISFPPYGEIMKTIDKRHDFVHRNGKDKEGNDVLVNIDIIQKMLKDVRVFVESIDSQIEDVHN